MCSCAPSWCPNTIVDCPLHSTDTYFPHFAFSQFSDEKHSSRKFATETITAASWCWDIYSGKVFSSVHCSGSFSPVEVWKCIEKHFKLCGNVWSQTESFTGGHMAFQSTNTQIHKYTNTQIHKYTNTQIYKYTQTHTQIHKESGTCDSAHKHHPSPVGGKKSSGIQY